MRISDDFKETAKHAGLAFAGGGALTGSLLFLLQARGVIESNAGFLVLLSGLAAAAWAARSVHEDLQNPQTEPQ
ncbi:MAG: hypothetical protein WBK55_10365 [Alphaproteobacteria bacterium]